MSLFLAALAGAVAASYLLVRFAALHLPLTADVPDGQPQKFHAVPTPRVGGLAVVAGLFVAGLTGRALDSVSATFLWLMIAALLPAFLGGFAEDLTRRVAVSARLMMTLVSAAIAFVWLDANLHRSDIDWLDAAFRYWPLSLAGTLLAVAGLAHAMNLIDGYHGLSAGVGVIALLALAVVARRIGDAQLTAFAFAAAGAYGGFLLYNYPAGRIFQGDGGAYLLGTILAILSAQLVGRHPEVSPWFPFVLVVYPVWETLFTMLRRATFHRAPIGAPDALHLHSLIYRCLGRRNAATAPPLWALQLSMAGLGLAWYDDTAKLQLQAYGFVALYCVAYAGLAALTRPQT